MLFQDLLPGSGAADPSDLPGSAAAGRRSDSPVLEPGPQLCPALPHLTAHPPQFHGHTSRASAGAGPGAGGTERGQPHGAPAGVDAVRAVVLSDPVPAVFHGAGHGLPGGRHHPHQPGGLWRLQTLSCVLIGPLIES